MLTKYRKDGEKTVGVKKRYVVKHLKLAKSKEEFADIATC